MKQNKVIGIIGMGNMGSAIARSLADTVPLLSFDIDKKKCARIKKFGIKTAGDAGELTKRSDIIILAIKPQEINLVLDEIKRFLSKDKLIVSIAAGITTEYIEGITGKIRVVRVMPNIAILVEEGSSAICCGKYATESDEKITLKTFSAMGKVFKIPEKFMDAATVLSGSGPAYFLEVINSLIKTGVKLGFSLSQAKGLVFQAVRGTIAMLEQISDNPVTIRDMVASKKGVTIEALKILQKNHLEKILMKAVFAAKKRAGELAGFQEKHHKT